jgi:signal transduction histidine kinase
LALKEESKKKLDPELKAYVYNNLGYIFLKQKKYNELPKLFEKAIVIFDSVQNYNECSISNIYLSDYYFQKKDTIKAIEFSEKALVLSSKIKSAYYLASLSHAGSVNKEKAPSYIKRYHELNDSLLFQERKARNQFFKIQLETDQIVQEKDTIISKKTLQNSIITIVLSIVILLFIVFRLKAKQKQLQLTQEQQKANEEIYLLMLNQQEKEEKIKLSEKKRIALELHDNVLNKLASTRFNLFAISKNTNKKTIDNALEHINKIQDIENEIRDITHDLNKNLLEEYNSFKFLLLKYIEELNSTYNTRYQIEIDDTINWIVVNNTVKLQLYRTIQEAIHNVNKHANATEVSINIILDENNIAMSINDNGIGFDINTTKKGIGLKNMQQLIDAVGGKINIQSTKNSGTSIFISRPIE